MINRKLRNKIQREYGDVLLYDNQSYDNSIIGVIFDKDRGHYRAVYSRAKMEQELAEELMKEDKYDSYEDAYEDAVEWIEYNTERSYYTGELPSPVIFHEEFDDEVDYDTFTEDYSEVDRLLSNNENTDSIPNNKEYLVRFWKELNEEV